MLNVNLIRNDENRSFLMFTVLCDFSIIKNEQEFIIYGTDIKGRRKGEDH